MVISGPVSSYDGRFGRGRRNGVYLRRAIKKICLSGGKKAVPILVVDVSDQERNQGVKEEWLLSLLPQ